MSDTPRTDKFDEDLPHEYDAIDVIENMDAWRGFARQLERELVALKKDIIELCAYADCCPYEYTGKICDYCWCEKKPK